MLQRVIYYAVLTLCSYWLIMPLAQATVFNIEQADRSVVRVINFGQNSDTGSGTGFVVSANIVVTNEHVIAGYRRVVVMQPPSSEQLVAEVLWQSADKDLAILKVPQLTAPAVALATALPQKGDALYVVGFPGIADELGGVDAIVESTVSNGILGRTFRAPWHSGRGQPLQILQHNAAMNQGNSGGPLFDACGHVVGVNTMGATGELDQNTNRVIQSAGVFGSSHIAELLPALNQLGIAFESAAVPCQLAQSHASIPNWLYGTAGVAILILLALALQLMQLRNQVKAGTNPPFNSVLIRKMVGIKDDSAAEKSTPGLQDYKVDDHGRKYRFDPIKGMEYLSDKPINHAEKQAEVKPQPPVEQSNPWFLQSLSGQANIVLPLNRTMVIGRDPNRCDITLSDNRISQVHAKLTLTAQGLMLEDVGSVNGSLINQQLVTGAQRVGEGDIVQFTQVAELARYRLVRQGAVASQWQLHSSNPAQLAVLQQNKPLYIGRAPTNDVVVNNPHVSSVHCCITLTAEGVTVEDKSSTNGTYLGAMENRISRASLPAGQRLYLGTTDVFFIVTAVGEGV